MGRVADAAGIQFRVLNASKGPAVRGPRAQADRRLYREAMQAALAEQPNLTVVEAAVEDLVVDHDGRCRGVVAGDGAVISAGAVVLTTGPFLRGLIQIGRASCREKSVSVRVDLGGRRSIKKKKQKPRTN